MLGAQTFIIFWSLVTSTSFLIATQTATRWSGRLSLAIFSWLVFAHLRDARYKPLFLIFAAAHGIHLVELLLYQHLMGNLSSLVSPGIAGGVLAYAVIFAMPVIQRKRAWTILKVRHLLVMEYCYLFLVWIVFAMTYIPRILALPGRYGGRYVEFVAILSWLIFLFIWKMVFALAGGRRTTGN